MDSHVEENKNGINQNTNEIERPAMSKESDGRFFAWKKDNKIVHGFYEQQQAKAAWDEQQKRIDEMQKSDKSQDQAWGNVLKNDCEKALIKLAGAKFATPLEGYGTNSSWAISDLCRCIHKQKEHLSKWKELAARMASFTEKADYWHCSGEEICQSMIDVEQTLADYKKLGGGVIYENIKSSY